MDYPAPDRSDLRVNEEPGIDPHEKVADAWYATGTFADGRPWRAEKWVERYGGWLNSLTVFFSTRGIEQASQEELAELIEREGLIKYLGERRSVEAKKIQDAADNEMWSVSVLLSWVPETDSDDRMKEYAEVLIATTGQRPHVPGD